MKRCLNTLMIAILNLSLILFAISCGGGGGGESSTPNDVTTSSDQFTPRETASAFLSSGTIVYDGPDFNSYCVDQSKLLEYTSEGLYTVNLTLRRSSDLSILDSIIYDYTAPPFNYASGRTIHAITMANNYVYDFDGYDLNVYDVSSSSFRLVDDTNSFTTENHASESLIHGGYLYLFGTSRIDVFNLSDPAKPQFERSVSTGDMGADQGDHCAGFVDNFYVVNNDTKLGIYELNSGNPSLMWSGIVGGIDFTSRHAVAIGNNQIFVNTGDHIDIYLVDGTGRPYLYQTTSIENSGTAYLFANDNVLYVCRGGAEALPYSDFALYDISNMGDPVLIDAVEDSRCRSTSRPIFTDSAMFLSFMDGETIWVKFNLSAIPVDTTDDEELVVSNFNWSVNGRYSTCAAMEAATGNLQFQSTSNAITGYSYTGEDWHHDCTVTYIGTVNSNISYLNLNDPLTVSEVEDFCGTIIPGMVVTVTEHGTSRFACSFYDTFDGSTEIVTFTK